MILGIESISNNVGMTFENVILLVVLLAGIIPYAKDFTLGLMLHMFANGLLFLWFYGAGWNYVPALVLTLMFFVMMCLSLYATQKKATYGGFV